MTFIRENGGVLAVLAAVAVASGIWIEWRISTHLSNLNLPSDDRLVALKDEIGVVREQHNDDRDRMDNKIERVVDILLEE